MTSGTWDRHRGHEDSYDVVDFGFNFRLDEPRAALGLVAAAEGRGGDRASARDGPRLPRAARANAMFDDVDGRRASHFAFTVLFDDVETRVRVREALAAARIQTTRYPAAAAA